LRIHKYSQKDTTNLVFRARASSICAMTEEFCVLSLRSANENHFAAELSQKIPLFRATVATIDAAADLICSGGERSLNAPKSQHASSATGGREVDLSALAREFQAYLTTVFQSVEKNTWKDLMKVRFCLSVCDCVWIFMWFRACT
jgi:hypothetical protein